MTRILLVGPTITKDPDGHELIQTYKTIIEGALGDDKGDITIATTLLDEILIDVSPEGLTMYDSQNNRHLSEYDVLIMRGHGISHYVDIMGAMTLYAKTHDITMVNEHSIVRDPSKLLQNVHFQALGLSIPRTLYVNRGLLEHTDWAKWTFPGVMKQVNGSLGRNNFIVKSWQDIEEISARDISKRYILQSFVPNTGDYRVLLAGEDLLIFKRVSAEGSHLNNTSSGGSAFEVDPSEIPEEIIAQARAISRQYGMSLSGVDVMQHSETGEYYFLEVNMQPQLSTGALLEQKQALLGTFIKKLADNR